MKYRMLISLSQNFLIWEMVILANGWGKMTYYFRYNVNKALNIIHRIFYSYYIRLAKKKEHTETWQKQWIISDCLVGLCFKQRAAYWPELFSSQGKSNVKYELDQVYLLFHLKLQFLPPFPCIRAPMIPLSRKKTLYLDTIKY